MPTHCIAFKAFQYLFQCLALIDCIQLTKFFTNLQQPTERRLLFSIIRWILKLFDKSIVDLAILLLRYFIALGFLKRLPEFAASRFLPLNLITFLIYPTMEGSSTS